MRATHDQQISLFGGECVAPGYRGRRNSPQITKKSSSRLAVVFAAALIGFATAATAISVRNSAPTEVSISAGYNLMGGVPGAGGLAAALY